MNTTLPLLGLLGLAHVAAAQDPAPSPKRQTVSVGILGLAPTLGLEYALRLGGHGAIALQGSRYFSPNYPGYQAALVGRYYFRAQPLGSVYLQLSAGAFTHQAKAQHYEYPSGLPLHDVFTTTVHGQGGGLGLGYRWPLGPRLSLNTLAGLKFYFHDLDMKGGPRFLSDWSAPGQPGSVWDAQVSLGYTF